MSKLVARGIRLVLCAWLLGALPSFSAETSGADALQIQTFSKQFNTPLQHPWIFSRDAGQFSRVLAVPAGASWDLRAFRGIAVQALRQQPGPGVVRLRWAVKSRVGGLYLGAQSHIVPSAEPGKVALDIAPDAGELIPSGHQRPWDALSAASVVAIELRAEPTFPVTAANASFVLQLSKAGFETAAKVQADKASVFDLSLEAAPAGTEPFPT